jgi:hypothetical protein
MNKDDIMKYALIAGGAYAVYWYVTNHGPLGAVFAADGVTKVTPSYWDSWFGTTVTAPVVTQPTTPVFTPVAQAPGTPVIQTPPAPSAPALNLAQLTTAVLSAANANANTVMNADQWNFYRNNIQPPALTPDQFGTLLSKLPAGVTRDAMTVDQFMNALYNSQVVPGLSGGIQGMGMGMGMGDVVPVQSRPSVPMMSFGGGFNAFQQKKNWSN